MQVDFPQLQALVAIVEHGSFGAAARELRLSQSAISERIANLEGDVGLRLLERGRRRCETTAAGRVLYEHAVSLLRARQRLHDELRELGGDDRGSLTLGASTIPGEHVLPAVLASFATEHPHVRIALRIADSERVAAEVEQGRLELGVIGTRLPGAALEQRALWKDDLVVVVPRGHAWARRRQIDAEALTTQPFLIREAGSGTRRWLESSLPKEVARSLRVAVELGSTHAIKEAVIHGLGISILSERAVRSELALGSLVALRLRGISLQREIQLVTPRSRSLSPLARRMVAFLRQSPA